MSLFGFLSLLKLVKFPAKKVRSTNISLNTYKNRTKIKICSFKKIARLTIRVRLTFRKENEKIKLEYQMKIFINFKLLIPTLAILIKMRYCSRKTLLQIQKIPLRI